MDHPGFRLAAITAVLVHSILLPSCGQPAPPPPSSNRMSPQDSATVLALDRAYWEAERTKDWQTVSGLLSPNYYGIGNDFEIDRSGVEADFSKINLTGYELQPPRIRFVRPDLAVVSYLGKMNEEFDGADISGRYWFSTTWLLTDGQWKLLVEEEVSLDKPPAPSH